MYEEHGNKISKTLCFYVLLFFVLFFIGPKFNKLKSIIIQLPYQKDVELEIMEENFEEENCNPGFALASLQQYEQFRRIVINSSLSSWELDSKLQLIQEGSFSNSDAFLVKVQIVELANLVKLRIVIATQHNELQRGASFKVHFESKNFLASYSIRDNVDGKYRGCYLVPKYCFTLTVDLLFVGYAAYYDTSPCPLKNSQIHKKAWCPLSRQTTKSRKTKLCTNGTSFEEGMWVTNNDLLKYAERYQSKSISPWSGNVTDLNLTCTKHLFHRSSFKWFWKNTERNCVVNQANLSSRWKKCLQKFSSVYFLGDSHTRGLYSYIAHSVGANVTGDRKNKRKSTSYRNLHFQFMKYNRDVPRVFDKFFDNFAQIKLKRTNSKKNKGQTSNGEMGNNESHSSEDSTDKLDDHSNDDDDNKYSCNHNGKTIAVFFGFGTWQLSRVDFSSYFDTFPSIRQIFLKMVQFSKSSNMRWIYITTPSTWDNSKCFCKVSMNGNHPFANIFSTAAINAFTIQELKKSGLDFEIFDYNSLTVHRNNEIRDLIHYLIEPIIHNGQTVYGTVGVAVTDVLLTQLCPNT